MKELSLSGNALKNLEGVNQFKALENLDVSKNKITSVAISTPNNTITYIDLSHNFIPKLELELNENRIPKALAQHFPAVKGESIENNPLREEKKEEKEVSKKEGTAKKVDTSEAKSSPVEEQTADSIDKGSETKKKEKVQPDSRKGLDEEGNKVNNSEKE